MKRKKIKKVAKIFFILIILCTGIFAYLANEDMKKIYGAKTKVVDYKTFSIPNETICINNVNILSADGEAFIPNQTVCIENGIIISIDSIPKDLPNITIINGEGKFLIPGLIDSHVHLFKSQNDLLLYVANGITEIRELIGEEDHLKWRKEIKDGRLGPDMYIASPRLGSFGLVEGWFMKWSQGFSNIKNAKQAKRMVKKYARKGYNAVKIYSQLNKESFGAINKVAKSEGLDVIGHIPWSVTLSDVFRSNQSDIAHLEELMNVFRREFGDLKNQEGVYNFLSYVEKRSKEIIPELINNNISVTTTLWLTKSFVRQKFELEKLLKEVELVYENPGISEWNKRIPGGLGWLPEVNRYKLSKDLSPEEKAWQKIFWTTYGQACQIILKNLSDGGVVILAGTDTNLPPTVPGFSLHDELVAMNNAGMSASQVLNSATTVPAQRLKSNTGRIIKGKKANLVLLDENPLENISNTRKINTVFLNGRTINRILLDEILESVKNANNASRNTEISQYVIK